MKKRKAVAVCVTSYNWEYESRIIEGIREKCAADDIDLLIFSNLMTKVELGSDRVIPENVLRGELEIYNIINYDILDGIIVFGDNILKTDVLFDIAKKAAEHNVPIVNVSDPLNELEYNVRMSDKKAMGLVVDHLIEKHGLKKINFIGGFPGNIQTEERLEAYKKSLEKHGIPFDEKRVAYGRFWKWAQDCTREFLDSGDIPEAIVCASDTMSFFCMDEIKSRGLKIPDDIVVTGFDGIADCERYKPTITTVRHAYIKAGKKAVSVLESIWSGKKTPKISKVEAELIINESCGCEVEKKEWDSFYDRFYNERDHSHEFDFRVIDMNTKISAAETSEQLFGSAKKLAEFFELNELYICVSDDVEKGRVKFQNKTGYFGVGDRMVSMLPFGHDVPAGTVFPTKELIPNQLLGRDKPILMSFVPIYFRNCFLGYFAFCPRKLEGNGELFLTWTMNLSNNAGTFYLNKELQDVADELRNINMTDPLTGICNRRGLQTFAPKIMQNKSGYINIVCADVDGLKPINDTYGHEGGDNAIVVTASAIKNSMPKDAVCARTGGDEFCVVFHSETEEEAAQCVAAVEDYLVKYNEMSGLPYKVGCSCGFATVPFGKVITMEDMIKTADKNMYNVKLKRKTVRR
ncbi:MAG: GGDEF domain-containing protein [Oscillospiraceae bacterium]